MSAFKDPIRVGDVVDAFHDKSSTWKTAKVRLCPHGPEGYKYGIQWLDTQEYVDITVWAMRPVPPAPPKEPEKPKTFSQQTIVRDGLVEYRMDPTCCPSGWGATVPVAGPPFRDENPNLPPRELRTALYHARWLVYALGLTDVDALQLSERVVKLVESALALRARVV